MFLKSIKLTNIQCFSDFEWLGFDPESVQDGLVTLRPWTVLVGENGTGKSTLLRAIALVLSGEEGLRAFIKQPSDWVRRGESTGTIEVSVLVDGIDEQIFRLEIGASETIDQLVERNREMLTEIEQLSPLFFAGYGASRRLSFDSGATSTLTATSLFDRDARLTPLESWSADLDSAALSTAERVLHIVDDLFPGVTFSRIDSGGRSILFQTPNGELPLRLMGDGFQALIAWLGDLLARLIDSLDADGLSGRSGLLLVDEIDLHLHIQIQRPLLAALSHQLPQFQFIVTTHSPMIAQQAGPGELFYLDRTNDGELRLESFGGNPQDLLLNQLVTTPAFGLETDESLAVEEKKARYRALRDSTADRGEGGLLSLGSLGGSDDLEELGRLESELRGLNTSGQYTLISDDERALLALIQQQKSDGES